VIDKRTQLTRTPVDVAERSDPGRDPTKQVNEDACAYRDTQHGHLAIVCDGMGGHAGGREASNTALQTIIESVEGAAMAAKPAEVLKVAVERANERVYALAANAPAGAGRPGSTVVAILVHQGGTEVAHVGDSRIYMVQAGQIFPITRDHSKVAEMVQLGMLTPEAAAHHPEANKITRALGMDSDVAVEVRSQPIAHRAGDSFLLCSDGLSDLVTAPEMLGIVANDPPAQAVGKLVDLANARGGYDNVTALVVRARESAEGHETTPMVMPTLDGSQPLKPPANANVAGAPPLDAVIPPAPLVDTVVVRRPRRASPVSAYVGVGLVLAMGFAAFAMHVLYNHLSTRDGQTHVVAFDAAVSALPAASTSGSVELAPVEPPSADHDAGTPIDPLLAPSASPSVRHSHHPTRTQP
jgi:protein phosphatase